MFQGEPAFEYGNIHDMAPEEVAETVLFSQIEEREKKVLEGCARCAFYDLCYSGCMFHSLKDSRVLEEKDFYCAGYKMYFEHMLRRIHGDLVRATSVAAGALS
jgi:radical SAM protein with 4Fe4S-binding SPASM domain